MFIGEPAVTVTDAPPVHEPPTMPLGRAGVCAAGGGVGTGCTGWISPRDRKCLPETVVQFTDPGFSRQEKTARAGWRPNLPPTDNCTSQSSMKYRVRCRQQYLCWVNGS